MAPSGRADLPVGPNILAGKRSVAGHRTHNTTAIAPGFARVFTVMGVALFIARPTAGIAPLAVRE